MNSNPEVTVVIPHYGNYQFLEDAIQSVSLQSTRVAKIILVLDRPTDDVRDYVISNLSKKYDFFLTESKGTGIVDALNHGADLVSTKYMARLDSDDAMHYQRIEIQEKFLNDNPEVGVVGTMLEIINSDGQTTGYKNFPRTHQRILSRMLYQNCIAHPSVMLRTEIIKRSGGYRNFFTGSEDYELWLRLSKTTQLSNIALYLTKYRISDQQYTRKISDSRIRLDDAVRYYEIVHDQGQEFIYNSKVLDKPDLNFELSKIHNRRQKQRFEFASITNKLLTQERNRETPISAFKVYTKVVLSGFLKSPCMLMNMTYWKLFGSVKRRSYVI